MSASGTPIIDTSSAPTVPARRVEELKPALLLTQEHHMCPGCGEPVAVRPVLQPIGHMTATSVIGQRTKNSLDGRDAAYHGYPVLIGDLIAQLQGAAYVARGSVHNAGGVARTRKMFKRAFETQLRGEGFTFVEVLTMCPTGWFVPTADGPSYMQETLGEVHIMGELKTDGRVRTTEELHAENVAKQRELDEQLARGGIEK